MNLTSPSEEHHAEGSKVTLSCSAVSKPAALFYWFRNGAPLSGNGAELRLTNIQMSQSGNYSCQAFNNKTTRYEASQSVAVNVLGTPSPLDICAKALCDALMFDIPFIGSK